MQKFVSVDFAHATHLIRRARSSVPTSGRRAIRPGANPGVPAARQSIGLGETELILLPMLQPAFPFLIRAPSSGRRNANSPPMSALAADAADSSPKDRLTPEETT